MSSAIGNRIKVLMTLHNVSTDLLAKSSGLNKFQIDNILQGKSKKVDLLLKIAKSLNISLDLICDVDEASSNILESNHLSYELPLCIEMLSSKHSVVLTKELRNTITSVVTNNSVNTDTYKELIQRINGIIILIKDFPAVADELVKKP